MKVLCSQPNRFQAGARNLRGGFTFTEMIVATAIHMLLLAGVISGHLFGLSMLGFAQTGLSGGDQGRKINNLLTADIRAAKYVMVGQVTFANGTNTFTEAQPYSAQQGQAIQICTTANTNSFIKYYIDTTISSNNCLTRVAPGDHAPVAVARYVGTNSGSSPVFTIEDFAGNVALNRQSSFILGVNLQFYQLDNPFVTIGPGNYFDSFLLRLKISSRSPD